MRRAACFALFGITLAACTIDNPFADDEKEETETTAAETETGPSEGDGDGDPGVGDGDGEGEETGDGDGEAELCQRYRYTYRLAEDSWTRVLLDQVWTGPNAPPCSVRPMATTFVEPWDQLLVWGDDRMFYRRIDGAWQTPEPMIQHWAAVDGLPIQAAHNRPPHLSQDAAVINLVGPENFHTYDLFEDGSTVFTNSTTKIEWEDPGPPAMSTITSWVVSMSDVEVADTDEWWQAWVFLVNNRLYYTPSPLIWENWTPEESELFDDAPVNVSPNTFEAGWSSHALQRLDFIGP